MSTYDVDDILLDLADPFEDAGDSPTLPLTPVVSDKVLPGKTYDARRALSHDVSKLFKFDPAKLTVAQQAYIMGFAMRGTKKGGCDAAGVSYPTVTHWMDDPYFREQLDYALDIVRDTLEEELLNRAMTGSDKLLVEAVKAARPEKYNKKSSDVNVNGQIVHTWADLAQQAEKLPVKAIPAEYKVIE